MPGSCSGIENFRALNLRPGPPRQYWQNLFFADLIASLSREHNLIYHFATRQAGGGESLLSKLPKELQQPMSSVEEFRDALVRILRNS